MAARVLHLLETNPDYQTQTAVAQLTRDPAVYSQLCTIGRGGEFGSILMATMHLPQRVADFELIHAWGFAALLLAALRGSSRPVVYTPTRFPNRSDIRWLRALLAASAPIHVICPTDTMRRTMVEQGVPIERCHLIRPGVDFSRIGRRRDEPLRTRLGFSSDDFVIAAAGESVRGANHHASVLAAAVLNVFDPKYKLLMWGRGTMVAGEIDYARQMLPGNFVSVATRQLGSQIEFEPLMSAADAMLVTADAPVPTLPIAVGMAAGRPIIAVVSPTVAELLEDRHSALMVGRANSRLLARRMLDLQEDPQLRWMICDTARTEAYEFFSMTRFISQFRAVYEQVAERKQVEVPPQAPGAGLRFMGRG